MLKRFNVLWIGILLAASFFLSGQALAEEVSLSGAELTTLLTGNNFSGATARGMLFTKVYNADGTYVVSFPSGGERHGNWVIKEDLYCSIRNEVEICYSVKKDGEVYKMYEGEDLRFTFKKE